MGINLGCRQIAVPQQHLHNPQIGAMIEQMGGKGMAQRMRRQMLFNIRFHRIIFYTMPKGLPRHFLTTFAQIHIV